MNVTKALRGVMRFMAFAGPVPRLPILPTFHQTGDGSCRFDHLGLLGFGM